MRPLRARHPTQRAACRARFHYLHPAPHLIHFNPPMISKQRDANPAAYACFHTVDGRQLSVGDLLEPKLLYFFVHLRMRIADEPESGVTHSKARRLAATSLRRNIFQNLKKYLYLIISLDDDRASVQPSTEQTTNKTKNALQNTIRLCAGHEQRMNRRPAGFRAREI